MTHPLHMIGNAHLDPVWLWRWPDGCAEAIGTCWAAVDLLAAHPGVVFTRGEAAVYRWIEELEPALFERIQHLASAGRWAIVNGWWLQPDCNLPHGEAFIRQGLYGKAYFREKFGIDVTVGYNVDSFGHAATLPMLLRHTGYDSYVFMRPMAHEKTLPGALFDWVAPDGSRVTTFRLPLGYNTHQRATVAERMAAHQSMSDAEGVPFMCFYGIGNHGGGPTREDVAAIDAARAGGQDIIYSSPPRYFEAVADVARPEVRDELQFHSIGCYAAISRLKQLNRTAEARLAQAEAACALAAWQAGASYPRARLESLWQSLLFNQFHDILGGTSIASATHDAIQALGGVIQGADEVMNGGLRRLAATVKPGPEPRDATFLAVNLSGVPARTPVEMEPWLDWGAAQPHRLLDEQGQEVPYQDVMPEAAVPGLQRILFAPDVPSLGYRLFRFAEGKPRPAAPSSLQVQENPPALENAVWRLDVDTATGGIARLVDKRAGVDVLAGTAHLPTVVDDPSDTWSHGIDRFGFTGDIFVCEGVEIVERGPLRAALRVRARFASSTITNTYLMYQDSTLPIEIRVQIDWRQQRQLLRLRYPIALASPEFRYEAPYGSMVRPADGREWPGQRWVLMSGSLASARYGIAVANDAKYSYAANAEDEVSSLYLTALRSPVYAHHQPYTLQPQATYSYIDQGEQSFTMRLLAGPEVDALAAYQLAEELTRPLVTTPHVSRGGTAESRASLLGITAQSSVLTWLKGAEDGGGLVARVLEVEGRADEVMVHPSGSRFTVPAYGIATLRSGTDGHWTITDGLET